MTAAATLANVVEPAFVSPAGLATYASVSLRTTMNWIAGEHLPRGIRDPLPHYKMGTRIAIRINDFEVWIAPLRREGPDPDDQIAELDAARKRLKRTSSLRALPASRRLVHRRPRRG